MSDMNLCIFQGNLTRDPESKTVNGKDGEITVVRFTIAVNASRAANAKAVFVDCEAWGKDADTIAKFFTKGKPIRVLTEQMTDVYDDKDGKKVYRTKHRVNPGGFSFVNTGKPAGEEGETTTETEGDKPAAKPTAKTTTKAATKTAKKPEPEVEESDSDEDIPF